MFPVRHELMRPRIAATYVCLTCRLRTQCRSRSDKVFGDAAQPAEEKRRGRQRHIGKLQIEDAEGHDIVLRKQNAATDSSTPKSGCSPDTLISRHENGNLRVKQVAGEIPAGWCEGKSRARGLKDFRDVTSRNVPRWTIGKLSTTPPKTKEREPRVRYLTLVEPGNVVSFHESHGLSSWVPTKGREKNSRHDVGHVQAANGGRLAKAGARVSMDEMERLLALHSQSALDQDGLQAREDHGETDTTSTATITTYRASWNVNTNTNSVAPSKTTPSIQSDGDVDAEDASNAYSCFEAYSDEKSGQNAILETNNSKADESFLQLLQSTSGVQARGNGPVAWSHPLCRPRTGIRSAYHAQTRFYHTNSTRQQQAVAAAVEVFEPPVSYVSGVNSTTKPGNSSGIRAQLRRWQGLHGDENTLHDAVNIESDPDTGDSTNNLTRLPDGSSLRRSSEDEDDEREAMAHFMQSKIDEPADGGEVSNKFLRMGDLVDLEYPKSERESIVAIFVRRINKMGQFYTMQGRWLHALEKQVQYSIPGWVSPDMVRPLLDHLPSPDTVEEHFDTLMEEAYLKDLSVPRHIAAPLVTRLVQFHTESQAIYRKHASTLDNAHNILAHETDLRYGSLVSAAMTLLKTPADKLSLTALYALRQALTHAGFAFNVDRRSHRLTGYLQIRSKEQVMMVEQVRRWLREWQDDLAYQSTITDGQLRKHRPAKGAEYVYSFLEKARTIVKKSREDRQPTPYGNIGPSKIKLPITPNEDCVRIKTNLEFTEQDANLVRFIEAWCLSNMFLGLPRVESLPPLILQATGLYEEHDLRPCVGLIFLQELGTIMPYENRVRFDQHLLLPSSQHSKPLQNLMTNLLVMADKHNFSDSMAELRHDWKGLPVYCIDKASAHEIDDGLSLEQAGFNPDSGKEEWWVHVHIANPTAFFSRDHPLAKMARHMGESIYMPERTYMMLPRWSTQRHFSLGENRPCLTFSAKMDNEGQVLERKIRPGTVRNVMRLTPKEISALLGVDQSTHSPEVVLTVGGKPPAPRSRKSVMRDVSPSQVEELRTLRRLAENRQDIRKAAGGVFFDMQKPEIDVWQTHKNGGLAWDHPHRRGSRTVEGDPVLRLRTRGLINWFSPQNDAVDVLVREMMLLACEVAATWCSERQIPAIFRGSVPRPDQMDSDVFFRETLAPAAERTETGEYPMHLGMQYLQTFGTTQLRTKPFKHRILGMDYYGKVTSPLRRYGDMILHWQIEAALREEAATGRSLISSDPNADRRFLPFSATALDTIIVGIQPRENIITSAKSYAENFWISLLLFRAFHFGEADLPFKTFRAFLQAKTSLYFVHIGCVCVELNISCTMLRPDTIGLQMPVQGDVWECEIDHIDVYHRTMIMKPLRLLERMGQAENAGGTT